MLLPVHPTYLIILIPSEKHTRPEASGLVCFSYINMTKIMMLYLVIYKKAHTWVFLGSFPHSLINLHNKLISFAKVNRQFC
jgi:hypothetical protein